jgi:3-oxoacyl-ACP reductase-like protein
MKAKKTTVQEELSTEQLSNNEVIRVFDLITQAAREVVSNFETKKYRTSVMVDHLQNNNNSLIREYLSYFFNVTLTRNKHSLLVIYIGFDSEAITRFGSMLHNLFLREVMKQTMKEATEVNIESCIRIDANTKEVRNYFYKRITDGANEYATITIDEPVITEVC